MAHDVALSLHVLDQALSHLRSGGHMVPQAVYQRLLHADSPLARLRCDPASAQGTLCCGCGPEPTCKDWMCVRAAYLALPAGAGCTGRHRQ